MPSLTLFPPLPVLFLCQKANECSGRASGTEERHIKTVLLLKKQSGVLKKQKMSKLLRSIHVVGRTVHVERPTSFQNMNNVDLLWSNLDTKKKILQSDSAKFIIIMNKEAHSYHYKLQ